MRARRAAWLGAAWLSVSGAAVVGCDTVFGIGTPTLAAAGGAGGSATSTTSGTGGTGGRTTTTTSTSTTTTTTTTSTSTTTTTTSTSSGATCANCTSGPCNTAYCDAGACVSEPVNSGNKCGPATACSEEICSGGACLSVNLTGGCGDAGGMCNNGACQIPTGGACAHSADCASQCCCALTHACTSPGICSVVCL